MLIKANIRLIAAAILAVLTLTSSVFAGTYGWGTGEPNDPYLICDVNDLLEMRAEPNDWDKHFLLVNDINLADITGTQFNIIGNDSIFFTVCLMVTTTR